MKSYNNYLLGILIVGLATASILILSAQKIYAVDYGVSASVLAPLPAEPAIITSPLDLTTADTMTPTISGTCPVVVPAVFVLIIRNGGTIGSSQCTPSGKFTVVINLLNGQNDIYPQTVTVTNQAGPAGSLVRIISPEATSTKAGIQPLLLHPQIEFLTFTVGEPAVIRLTLIGGEAPYDLNINWGDGITQKYTYADEGDITLSHTYEEAKLYKILIVVTDNAGSSYQIVIAASTLLAKAPLLYSPDPPANTDFQINRIALYMLGITGLLGWSLLLLNNGYGNMFTKSINSIIKRIISK